MKNEELYKAYSAADLAIWPNQSSMSMLEAMACRCPVIASDMKVNSERLNNDRGVLFENGNLESLVNAILDTVQRRESISENAFKWVQLYDWEKLARESVSV
jgi:glycosyltransferase involved in cell wall biosynthesis